MKKNYLPLLAISIALVAIGLFVQSRMAGSNTSSDKESAKDYSSGSDSSASYGDLLDVSVPGSLPSVIKNYEGFRLSFNKDNATPNWVAWELRDDETGGEVSRNDKFWQDTELDGCPATYDYTGSGYDRGHMCPAADQKWSQDAMSDCFVLSNICPQDHSLNSGAWSTLEKKERLWAKRDGSVIIVAGPVYTPSDTSRIGDAGVRVPSAFFKVMIAPYIDKPRGIAFVYPNMKSPGNMQNYSTTIDAVEQLTGFDFFHTLPDDLENEIESKASFKEWSAAE